MSISLALDSRGNGRLILTVTLNAAVDKTYRIEDFSLDRVHRPSEWRMAAGGKGINVARALKAFGENAVATGFLGGYNGSCIAGSLESEGIESDFVQTREESRVCIAVVDPLSGSQTEINEAGPEISEAELASLTAKFEGLLGSGEFRCAVLSGSIPPGVPSSIYAELIELAWKRGVPCALDASGKVLSEGIQATPWMVKPNIHELSSLSGKELPTETELIEAACELQRTGIETVLVTCGSRGAYVVTGDGVLRSSPPEVEFISAVGSGDAFLAAYLWAIGEGKSREDSLRLATGAGAANATKYGSCFISAEDAFKIAEHVTIEALN